MVYGYVNIYVKGFKHDTPQDVEEELTLDDFLEPIPLWED